MSRYAAQRGPSTASGLPWVHGRLKMPIPAKVLMTRGSRVISVVAVKHRSLTRARSHLKLAERTEAETRSSVLPMQPHTRLSISGTMESR